MVIPYFPSAGWYARWYGARIDGASDGEAALLANEECMLKGKDFSRCRIISQGRPIVLSVAIEGGAHALCNHLMLENARISHHGNWQHVHLGAIEAAYRRSAWYQHVIPTIADILGNVPRRLDELTAAMHEVVAAHLPIPAGRESIKPAVVARGMEIAATIDPDVSILDPLMRCGYDTVLGLISLKDTLSL